VLTPSGHVALNEFTAIRPHFRDAADRFPTARPETAVKTTIEHPPVQSHLPAVARSTAGLGPERRRELAAAPRLLWISGGAA
jgi:hypothetical protein